MSISLYTDAKQELESCCSTLKQQFTNFEKLKFHLTKKNIEKLVNKHLANLQRFILDFNGGFYDNKELITQDRIRDVRTHIEELIFFNIVLEKDHIHNFLQRPTRTKKTSSILLLALFIPKKISYIGILTTDRNTVFQSWHKTINIILEKYRSIESLFRKIDDNTYLCNNITTVKIIKCNNNLNKIYKNIRELPNNSLIIHDESHHNISIISGIPSIHVYGQNIRKFNREEYTGRTLKFIKIYDKLYTSNIKMLGISGTNKDIISSHTFLPHEYLVHEEKIFINHNLKTPIIIKDIGYYSDEQKKKFIKKRYNTFFRLRDNISKRCYDPIIHLNYGNTDSLCNDLENQIQQLLEFHAEYITNYSNIQSNNIFNRKFTIGIITHNINSIICINTKTGEIEVQEISFIEDISEKANIICSVNTLIEGWEPPKNRYILKTICKRQADDKQSSGKSEFHLSNMLAQLSNRQSKKIKNDVINGIKYSLNIDINDEIEFIADGVKNLPIKISNVHEILDEDKIEGSNVNKWQILLINEIDIIKKNFFELIKCKFQNSINSIKNPIKKIAKIHTMYILTGFMRTKTKYTINLCFNDKLTLVNNKKLLNITNTYHEIIENLELFLRDVYHNIGKDEYENRDKLISWNNLVETGSNKLFSLIEDTNLDNSLYQILIGDHKISQWNHRRQFSETLLEIENYRSNNSFKGRNPGLNSREKEMVKKRQNYVCAITGAKLKLGEGEIAHIYEYRQLNRDILPQQNINNYLYLHEYVHKMFDSGYLKLNTIDQQIEIVNVGNYNEKDFKIPLFLKDAAKEIYDTFNRKNYWEKYIKSSLSDQDYRERLNFIQKRNSNYLE